MSITNAQFADLSFLQMILTMREEDKEHKTLNKVLLKFDTYKFNEERYLNLYE